MALLRLGLRSEGAGNVLYCPRWRDPWNQNQAAQEFECGQRLWLLITHNAYSTQA